jgi:hypothetical protein
VRLKKGGLAVVRLGLGTDRGGHQVGLGVEVGTEAQSIKTRLRQEENEEKTKERKAAIAGKRTKETGRGQKSRAQVEWLEMSIKSSNSRR